MFNLEMYLAFSRAHTMYMSYVCICIPVATEISLRAAVDDLIILLL